MPNKGQSAREWLLSLEVQDENVAIYMSIHRSRTYLKSGSFPADDLDPATLLGLAETLVNVNGQYRRALNNIQKRLIDPPILLVDKTGLGRLTLEPGGVITAGEPGTVISADEWPKTERTVIEVSKVIYFRDFLRSLWRRLTERSHP